MQTDTSTTKWMFYLGWAISLLPGAALLMSAAMKILKPPGFAEGIAKLQWDESLMPGLAITEAACALLYLFPRTAVLGAILCTGYLGGAVATHVRIQDGEFAPPIIIGVLLLVGLWLRDARVRGLAPWMRPGA